MGPLQLFALMATLISLASGAPDNRGTEFVIGYTANYALKRPVELYITTSRTTKVSVKVTAPKYSAAKLNEQFQVTAGYVHQIKITNKIRAAIGSELSTKGILVQADDEVVVYGTNIETYSNDAFLAFPTDVLGKEYYTVSHHPTTRPCEFMIIGVYDRTRVEITLASHSSIEIRYNNKRYYKNNKIVETLNRFSTLQLQTYGDLTGSYIKADKNIAVMSGNERTSVKPGGSRDTLVDQMLPVDTWGKKFAIVSTPGRTTGDSVRFIGSVDKTQVTINCANRWKKSFSVNRGKFAVYITPSKTACMVESSEAIMVVLIVLSQQSRSEPADPALITIPPMEQYGADYSFATPKYTYGEYTNHFMFIVKESEKSGLKANGVSFPKSTKYTTIPGTDYVGGSIVLKPGTWTLRHDSPISIFGGFMYGTANYETYGMPTGLRLAPINKVCIPTKQVVGDGFDNDCDGRIDEELCTVENKGKDDDGDGVSEEDCATPPPINGQWSAWATWSTCSVSCLSGRKGGTRTKIRKCNNPEPKYDGQQCVGGSALTESCTVSTACPIDGGWTSWGRYASCSVTCGSGTKTRTRSCSNPTPKYNGRQCSGSLTAAITCDTGKSCPIDGGFTSWSSWTRCSVTCGGGSTKRSRSCTNPSPQHGGASCVGDTGEKMSCNTAPCSVNGGWASWSSYTSCPVTCGRAKVYRSRACTNPAPAHGGADCAGDFDQSTSCNQGSCPIDGQYTDWGQWSRCTVTCGGGTADRSRTCTDPAPAYGGATCAGSSSEQKTCNTGNCPVDGGWTTWSAYGSCSVTCATGNKKRSRSCTNPTPQYNGAQCVGDTVSTATCDAGGCPIAGGLSSWGTWSRCTTTCGGGTTGRARSCTNPVPQYGGAACSGTTSESDSCNTSPCPIDGGWDSWSTWSSCPVSCGSGRIYRARTCTNPAPAYNGAACVGAADESTSCVLGNCPIDGDFTDWTQWNTCTVSCGGGTTGRSRTCTDPVPAHGGADCVGGTSEQDTCNTQNCPIDGGWTSWTAYGSCSVTCATGQKSRSRTCTNPSPQYNGVQCAGDVREADSCDAGGCPVNGGLTDWSSWTTCTVTCGGGTTERSRTCTNPAPQYGGALCSGNTTERLTCNTAACPIDGGWDAWTQWTSCSVTCATGRISRSRTCTNPAPAHNGADCPGAADETSSCVLGNCPIDGAWTAWNAWESCPVTCGTATIHRSRTCTNPSPAHSGADCVGDSDESTTCAQIACPIDGGVSDWGPTPACGVTCGNSTVTRTRTCDNPTPQHGGADCSVPLSETLDCFAGIHCPIDGAFTTWSAWDTCTVTCAGGNQGRTRTCTNPPPQYNGANCVGVTSENQACNTQNCPIDGDWTDWTAWSACSSTCGPGEISRDRTCTNPPAQYGGAGCFGDFREAYACNGSCTVHGNWGDWGSWTTCTATCDGGRWGRVRLCDDPAPTPDGFPCFGNGFEMALCNTQTCSGQTNYGNTTSNSSAASSSQEAVYVNRCPVDFFTCRGGGISCIREEFRCDCSMDCTDESDEETAWASCSANTTMMCENAAPGVHPNHGIIPTIMLSVASILWIDWIR